MADSTLGRHGVRIVAQGWQYELDEGLVGNSTPVEPVKLIDVERIIQMDFGDCAPSGVFRYQAFAFVPANGSSTSGLVGFSDVSPDIAMARLLKLIERLGMTT
jgi:hypothetical protein